MKKLITRSDYMADCKNLFNDYYAQFITKSTKNFIRDQIGIKKLRTSKCEHLNDLYSHSQGGRGTWIWDFTPMNMTLIKEAKEGNSMATHTCVGKECARRFLSGEYE